MPDQESLDYLLHKDFLEDLLPKLGSEQWLPVYEHESYGNDNLTIWCALLDEEAVERALSHDSWDLSIGHGQPGVTTSHVSGESVSTYYRYGEKNRIRPFLYSRYFSGAHAEYKEIEEEFRLYHNLAHDHDRNLLLDFDESGREIEVVRITEQSVKVRLRYIRQYQAATQQYLAIYFDSTRYSSLPIADVGEIRNSIADEKSRWTMGVSNCDFRDDYETFSHALGKVIIEPPPIEKSGMLPFKEDNDDKEVPFVIRVDGEGESIEFSSNPDNLGDYFGGNPGAPHYLTPVFFRREVLSKYYSEPDRFKVTDGKLTCLNLWTCRIDNDQQSNVIVFLGDLGRDMPYSERLHWKGFNVVPDGGISETKFRRGFLAEFADPKSPELVFKAEYQKFCEDWKLKFNWHLYLPLTPDDSHLLDTLRIPVSNAQPEFDDQVLSLTKLLIDSINEKELAQKIEADTGEMQGIAKIEAFLNQSEVEGVTIVIPFLRSLQSLRSTGVAHRKGNRYKQALSRCNIDLKNKPDSFSRLLEQSIRILQILRVNFIE